MSRLTHRQLFAAIAFIVTGLMSYGFYSQYVDGLEPCPLCMTQRFFYALTGLVALVAAVHHPRQLGIRIYGVLVAVFALAGAGVAGRQVWLQHLPEDKVPACGPDLEYMLEVFPFSDALKMLFMGDGNCAEVDWTFIGLSMAEWSLAWFVVLALTGGYIVFKREIKVGWLP